MKRNLATYIVIAVLAVFGIGGIAGGLGVGWFGVPGVFIVPTLLCIVAALGLLIQALVRHQP